MVDFNAMMVKTWTGEEKPVKKIAFFPEKDPEGELFYKIEGQNNGNIFMVQYSYDREKAWDEYINLLTKLIDFQVNNLQQLEGKV
jgi:hypothetical protein